MQFRWFHEVSRLFPHPAGFSVETIGAVPAPALAAVSALEVVFFSEDNVAFIAVVIIFRFELVGHNQYEKARIFEGWGMWRKQAG